MGSIVARIHPAYKPPAAADLPARMIAKIRDLRQGLDAY